MTHTRFITLAAIAAALILFAVLGFKLDVPVEFSEHSQLMPQDEWTLMRRGASSFEAHRIDRRSGNQQNFDLFNTGGGDLVRFSLARDLPAGTRLTAGEPVAFMRSHSNQATYDETVYELREAEAELRAAETGEKAGIVARARSELDAATAVMDQRSAEYARAGELLKSGVISQTAYELAESDFRSAQAGVETARNELQALESGEKQEIVAAIQAHVDLLRQRLRDAGRRAAEDTIRTPVSGDVVTLQADSVLIRIADVDTLYAIAPVPVSRRDWLRPGQSATLRLPAGSARRAAGEVVAVDGHATSVAGRNFFWVTVAIPNPSRHLRPGTRGELRFHGEKASLLGWLGDRIKHAGDRTLGTQ